MCAFPLTEPCPDYKLVEKFLLTSKHLRSDNFMEYHIFSPLLLYQSRPLERLMSFFCKSV